LKRRVRENQIDFIEGVATALTPLAFLETVMVKSYETLVDSDTKVDVNTGIIAVGRLKSLIDSRDYSHDLLVMKVQMDQICDAVKSTVPQEMWGEIIEKLDGSKTLTVLHSARQSPGSSPLCMSCLSLRVTSARRQNPYCEIQTKFPMPISTPSSTRLGALFTE
jgi:hypothetical protein